MSEKEKNILIAGALALSFFGVSIFQLLNGHYNLWYDELATITILEYDHFWTYLLESNHPPLYFMMTKVIWGLFGANHIYLKLFSLFTGSAFIFIFCRYTINLFGVVAGVLTSLLFLFSHHYLYYFQEIRPYGWVTLIVWLNICYLVKQLQEKEAKPFPTISSKILCLGLCSLYLSYISGMIFIVSGLLYLALRYYLFRKYDLNFILNWLISGLLFLPWFIGTKAVVVGRHFDLDAFHSNRNVFVDFLDLNLYSLNFSFLLNLLFTLSGLYYLMGLKGRKFNREDYTVGYAALFFFIAMTLLAFKSYLFSASYLMVPRYMVWWGIINYLAFGLFITFLYKKQKKIVLIIAASLIVFSISNKEKIPRVQKDYGEDLKTALEFIGKEKKGSERELLYSYVYNRKFLNYIFRTSELYNRVDLTRSTAKHAHYVNCDLSRWADEDLYSFLKEELTDKMGIWILYYRDTEDCGKGPLEAKRKEMLGKVLKNLKLSKKMKKSVGVFRIEHWSL